MKKIFLFILLSVSVQTFSQSVQLSVYSEVSILTVGPGDQLFTAFGHTAIRIKDPLLRFDYVYNYGMFDFNQPNFYLNFAKGKLLYSLGAYPYKNFVTQNNYEKRWLKEQVLELNQLQKQELFEYLNINLKPQNKDYLYDPFYNNCSTKALEVVLNLSDSISTNTEFIDKKKSIRTLMNEELQQNNWGSLGINIALGSKIDTNTDVKDYMYLPKFVYLNLKNTSVTINGKEKPFVKTEINVLDFEEIEISTPILNPLLLFALLFVLGSWISYKDFKRKKITKAFDLILFSLIGISGLGIVYLSFFSNHSTTPANLNILWCSPLSILVLFIYKKKKFTLLILKILTILLLLVPVSELTRIQNFNYTIYPLLLLLAIRYLTNIQLLSSKK